MVINIEELEKEVNYKTEVLHLLKMNEMVNNLTLDKMTFVVAEHNRTKIKYVYGYFRKSGKLKKRVKTLISTEDEFNIETENGLKLIQLRFKKYWKSYVKKYYPEHINLLKN